MSSIPNYFPKRPPPVTEEDFVMEMTEEAMRDLIIWGYHMAPDGTELTLHDIAMDSDG